MNDDKPRLQQMPPLKLRAETGVMQFGDDWPGLFIRGDNALHFGYSLKTFLSSDRASAMMPIERAIISGLADTLMSCEVGDELANAVQVTERLQQEQREKALNELTRLGQEMGDYDNDG